MLIFLAESKTMESVQTIIEPGMFQTHKPVLEDLADMTMQFISSLKISEIAGIMGISTPLAQKAADFAYEFPNKSLGYKSLYAFTGEAYRGLKAETLSKNAIQRAFADLKIISSAYGILSSGDIIKPYRLEYNKNCAPGNINLSKYLKPKVTVEIVKFLKESGKKEIINLLPADAEKCLDWKIIRAFAKVHKICFQEIRSGGVMKTPLAQNLKQLRGIMTRIILENNLSSFFDLKNFENPYFTYSEEFSKPGLPVFVSLD